MFGKPINNSSAWQNRTTIENSSKIMAGLRSAGLPLNHSNAVEEEGEESSARSDIVFVVSVHPERFNALLATPSGIVYKFNFDQLPTEEDKYFIWFAINNYYVVTANKHDRAFIAQYAEYPSEKVKGKIVERKSNDTLSGTTLEQLLEMLNVHDKQEAQASLF